MRTRTGRILEVHNRGSRQVGVVVLIAVCLVGVAMATARPTSKLKQASAARRAVESLRAEDLLANREPGSALERGANLEAQSACSGDCPCLHVSGDTYEPQVPTIASPDGSTYSVHHQLGGFIDPEGNPDQLSCLLFFNLNLPGAPDDIVTFDGLAETIRTDIIGTVPTVVETELAQPDGRRLITISTSSPPGTDLFPGEVDWGDIPLTHACFTIGIDDPLDWQGLDVVTSAQIEFLVDNDTAVGPVDITGLFAVPWNGFLNYTLPDGAGNGYNGVRLEMLIGKTLELTNDDCGDRLEVTDGSTQFTTIGATTDGNEEDICHSGGYADVGSDIWFQYNATCTGTLTVDLCNSDYDTKVAVYENCGRCPPSEGPIDCNDDYCGDRSRLFVPVVEDTCYTIRVGGWQGYTGSGSMILTCDQDGPPNGACCAEGECVATLQEADCLAQDGTWFIGETCPGFSCPVSPPPNDECADCTRILTGVPFTGSSIAATGIDVSSCGSNDSNDVWHCWTADCTGQVTFDTAGSAILDTILAIFDDCDGTELPFPFGCNDDNGANLHAKIEKFPVVEGTSYKIRVSGRNGEVGDYQLLVSTCKSACCAPPGPGVHFGCAMGTPAQCAAVGGAMRPPGSECLGDGDGNLIDDACEPCPPEASITDSLPDDGTVDARQPHASDVVLPLQGIGAPGDVGSDPEPILVQLTPRLADVEGCFSLCETDPDLVAGVNSISETTYLGGGVYQIILDHAISAGGATTIEYLGDGSYVEYIAHPGNVEGGVRANALDVYDAEHFRSNLIDCCLDGQCIPVWGIYSCDIDHSTQITPLDILTAVDLLNGGDELDRWEGTFKPVNNETCP